MIKHPIIYYFWTIESWIHLWQSMFSSGYGCFCCMVCLCRTYPALHLLRFFGGDVRWCFKVQHGLSSFLFILFLIFYLVMKSFIRYLSSDQVVDRYQFNDGIFQLTHYVQLCGFPATQDRSRTFLLPPGKTPFLPARHNQDMCSTYGDTRITAEGSAEGNTAAKKCRGKITHR